MNTQKQAKTARKTCPTAKKRGIDRPSIPFDHSEDVVRYIGVGCSGVGYRVLERRLGLLWGVLIDRLSIGLLGLIGHGFTVLCCLVVLVWGLFLFSFVAGIGEGRNPEGNATTIYNLID